MPLTAKNLQHFAFPLQNLPMVVMNVSPYMKEPKGYGGNKTSSEMMRDSKMIQLKYVAMKECPRGVDDGTRMTSRVASDDKSTNFTRSALDKMHEI